MRYSCLGRDTRCGISHWSHLYTYGILLAEFLCKGMKRKKGCRLQHHLFQLKGFIRRNPFHICILYADVYSLRFSKKRRQICVRILYINIHIHILHISKFMCKYRLDTNRKHRDCSIVMSLLHNKFNYVSYIVIQNMFIHAATSSLFTHLVGANQRFSEHPDANNPWAR